ncbi:Leaf-specific thionin [Thalictrum thalictroides]|uniref:Leaf-specific thionin n=1 Tax=Thalictrum thalictroides TaxID=46969 RepID=A0A7J6WJI7_THATH|nr:Leaf-specific thionin [Thalictrum thalictroides]
MEGKGVRAPFTAVIMGVLILGLVVAKIEAKSCCRNTLGRNCYNACRVPGTPRPTCATLCDCIHVTGNTCPPSHPRSGMLEIDYGNLAVTCPNDELRECFTKCIESEGQNVEACANKCGCYVSM